MVTPQERRAYLARIPWVSYEKQAQQCQGWLNRTPMKAAYSMFGRPPIGLDSYRCKQPAHWHFRALKRSFPKTGVYCMSHLFSRALYGDRSEEARTQRWLKRVMAKGDQPS